jgi:hypothetical protein
MTEYSRHIHFPEASIEIRKTEKGGDEMGQTQVGQLGL